MAKRSRHDFLSDLPLGIIHKILALVPIRDAVKTSILSWKWRYKWASLPELVFDDKCAAKDETKLNHIIHQSLLLHEGPIQKFELRVQNMDRCTYTDQWLLFLSRNDIRMLILKVEGCVDDLFEVHSSLYYCQNLAHLELFGCAIPLSPRTFKGFLCLRCLVLQNVDMLSDTIKCLVANSPLLEELTLEDNKLLAFNKNHDKLRIHAPNLKCFYFNGYCEEICLYAPLLSKLRVFLPDSFFKNEYLQQESPVCNYTKFLGGFTNLEELSGGWYFIEYLSIGIESCQRSLVFHRLRLIEFREMSYHDMKPISVFVHLITGAPNLHKLIISCGYCIDCELTTGGSISYWDSKFAPNFTFGRLKVVEMSDVYGGIRWVRLIKFLLERSPVLEMMILKPYRNRSAEQLLDVTARVLRFRRASTNAEILFSRS